MSTNNSETDSTQATSPARPRRWQRLFWWFAAVDSRVMEREDCSSDWRRHAVMGASVLVTALLAVFYGATVVYNYYIHNPVIAIVAGVMWGGIILVCDRLMLASTIKGPDTSTMKLVGMALPRFGLAILIAIAIGIPAELTLFQRRIDGQLLVDQQNEKNAQQQRITERFADIASLDSTETALRAEIKTADSATAAQFALAACEGDGTCGYHQAGNGFRYKSKLARYAVLRDAADRIRVANTAPIATIHERRAEREKQRAAELAVFDKTIESSNDLLSRMNALEHLEHDPVTGRTVRAASWVIRALAIILEILPLVTKIFSTRGAYEEAMWSTVHIQRARWSDKRETSEQHFASARTQRALIAEGVNQITGQMVDSAIQNAFTTEAAKKVQEELIASIVGKAAEISRRAADQVCDSDSLERDIRNATGSGRKRAQQRAEDAEAFKADVLEDLDKASAAAHTLWAEAFRSGKNGES